MSGTTWTKRQQKAHRKAWVKALRSGKYRQGTMFLKRDGGTSWCCLGVACDVSGLGRWEDGKNYSQYVIGDDHRDNDLPKEVREWLGLATSEGTYAEGGERGGGTCLSAQNDNYCTPFDKIADIIEAEPPGLLAEASK